MPAVLDRYLADLEERIDPAEEERLHAEWHAFAAGRFPGALFTPQRTQKVPPRVEWPEVLVNDTLADYERMALQQFRMCSQALAAGTGNLFSVRCNYGTSILPSLFDVDLFVMDRASNTLPTSWPLRGGADAIRALVDRGAPDITAGLGARTLAMGRRFVEWMEPYPKIRRYVHVYHPDLQGPMDVAEVVWGSPIFLELVDHPDLVKAFLQLITDTYVRFIEEWRLLVPQEFAGDCSVHWGFLFRGHVMLRDDSAMNLSPAMFAEFVEPYDRQLLEQYGGAIHFCGRGDHYADRFPALQGLGAINLSQPELNDMEAIFRNSVDQGIAILDLARQAAEDALARGRALHGRVHCRP